MPYDGCNHDHDHGPHGPFDSHHGGPYGPYYGPYGPDGYGFFRGGFVPNHFDWVDFNVGINNSDSTIDPNTVTKTAKILGYTILIGGIVLVAGVSIAILFL